jgi:integrase/recombinase XerD
MNTFLSKRTNDNTQSSRQDNTEKGRISEAKSDSHLIRLWIHGKSANTKASYLNDIEQFKSVVSKPLREVNLEDFQSWDQHLEEKYARSTRKRKLASVKSLFSFGHKIGYFLFNIGGGIKTPKLRQHLSERILSEIEIHRILALEDDLRNRSLLRLLYSSGARVSEVVSLRWRSLQARPQADAGQVTLFGKGDKTRVVLLSPTTWDELQNLRSTDQKDDFGSPSDPVFRSQQGGPLSRQQIWRIVKRAAKRSGIDTNERPVSPHWFRHAHASHALDRGAPTHLVKETLGHESLQTTSRYAQARPDDSSSRYLNA